MFNSADSNIAHSQNRTALGMDNIFGHRFDDGFPFQVNPFNPVTGINRCSFERNLNVVTCMKPLASQRKTGL
jgi:hypothetical protein